MADLLIISPLTTTFTPPPECYTLRITDVFVTSKSAFLPFAEWGFSCTTLSDGKSGEYYATPCYPPGFASYANRGLGAPVYSPGLVCPEGFTQACTMTGHESNYPPLSPDVSYSM